MFVGSEQDLTDPEFPERREELAQVLRNLKRAGVERVYVDEAFDRPSSPESDRVLNRALRDFGDAYLVNNLETDASWKVNLVRSIDAVGTGVPVVGADRERDLFGVVWNVPATVQSRTGQLRNAAVSLSGEVETPSDEVIPINYGFDLQSIPTIDLGDLSNKEVRPAVAGRLVGKRVVIGNVASGRSINIPGQVEPPKAMVHIYAAETLMAGFTSVPDYAIMLSMFALFLATAFLRHTRARRRIYLACGLACPVAAIVLAAIGSRASIGAGLVLIVIYAALRLRSKWKRDLLLVDEATSLPTFAALETERSIALSAPAIITAKMHRFEEVQRTLPPQLHAQYIRRIVERLKAASPELAIYIGRGHLLAFCLPERDQRLIREHLEGLRALFAAPLHVGGQQVDVGITFGVDLATVPDLVKRLANSVSAAERTNETYDPIVIADIDSDEEMLWNISLQARIDNALDSGEIYLNYQPKVLISTGEMIGVEALVRWLDPVKGMIPPDNFVRQCEQSGRMGHMTRYVLTEACHAGNHLAARGSPVSVAVNISATMLHDRAIVAMIADVLAQTGFDPTYLVLEITETYRISDFAIAADILGELRAFGAKISMDDFGVGAASLEALLRLPFAELKIDRLFISQVTQNPKALGIVRSILQLGQQLRIVVVAEGVEDQATLEMLREGGCQVAQGYGILRPAALDDIVQFRDRDLESRELIRR